MKRPAWCATQSAAASSNRERPRRSDPGPRKLRARRRSAPQHHATCVLRIRDSAWARSPAASAKAIDTRSRRDIPERRSKQTRTVGAQALPELLPLADRQDRTPAGQRGHEPRQLGLEGEIASIGEKAQVCTATDELCVLRDAPEVLEAFQDAVGDLRQAGRHLSCAWSGRGAA